MKIVSIFAVVRYYYWCCYTGWWLSSVAFFEDAGAGEVCGSDHVSICTIAELNTTANGWARTIVAAIENEQKVIFVDTAKLPASAGAVASFIHVLSSLTKSLEFKMYHDRVFFISQSIQSEYIQIAKAPELQELQVQPNDHIRSLYISKAALSHLPLGLKDFTKLEEVFAQSNNLTQLALASFSSNQKLTRVDVSKNRISLLLATNHTISIRNLHINSNRLTVVNMDVFEHVINLSTLLLHDNQIIQIGNTKPLKMATLDSLSLANNRLSSFQPLFAEFPVLTSLMLNGNNLTAMPRNLGKYPLLETLDLRANKLTRVDLLAIRPARKLKQLHLGQNSIASVSASTPFKQESLNHLGLGENKIVRINFTGCNFPKLQTIDLDFNQLTNVPQSVFQQFPSVSLLMLGNAMRCEDLTMYQKQLVNESLVVDSYWLYTGCYKTGNNMQVSSELRVCCSK